MVLSRLLGRLHQVSAEVVLCTLSLCYFLSPAITLSWEIRTLILCLVVWLIYQIDHLLEQYRSELRYRFWSRGIKWILVLTLLVAWVLALGLLPRATLIAGHIQGLLVMVYLLGIKRLGKLKEISVSILYMSGLMIAVWGQLVIPGQEFLLVGLLVLNNVLECSFMDRAGDREFGNRGLMATVGESQAERILAMLRGTSLVVFLIMGFYLAAGIIVLNILASRAQTITWLPQRMIPDLIMILPGLMKGLVVLGVPRFW